MGRKSVATIERGVWLLLNKCVMYGVCHLELELNSYDKEVAAALHSDHYNINTQLRFFFYCMYKYMYFSTSGEEVYTYVIRN